MESQCREWTESCMLQALKTRLVWSIQLLCNFSSLETAEERKSTCETTGALSRNATRSTWSPENKDRRTSSKGLQKPRPGRCHGMMFEPRVSSSMAKIQLWRQLNHRYMCKWAWVRRLFLAHILPNTALGEAWVLTTLEPKEEEDSPPGLADPRDEASQPDDSLLDL
eukprot:3934255-Amphidinium_carterae.1